MHIHKSSNNAPKKSNLPRNALMLMFSVLVLVAINFHIQKPALVFGGAVAVVLVHLALAGGFVHIVSANKKHFYEE